MGTRFTLLRPGRLDYQRAWELQRQLAGDVRAGGDPRLILLEHPPTYTLGTRGDAANLLLTERQFSSRGATVVRTDRGGDVTFHGPGQIVGYPILNVRALGHGPVSYVRMLESTIIDALAAYGIDAGRRDGARGVWVDDAKIAAIGVRISGGVTTHGFALNVNTDLSYFNHIIPCGLAGVSMTSMQALLGTLVDMVDVEDRLVEAFARQFDFDLPQEQDAMAGASVGS